MIDYLKCEILTTPEFLLSNPLLQFGSRIDEQTGEVIRNRHGYITKVTQFGSMQISITTNADRSYSKIELSGSIHKHQNNGVNYSDFSFSYICRAVNDICEITRLQPENFVLHHVEYGVNIRPTHSPESILNSIIAYKGKGYEIREYKGTGYMKRFCLSQYDVKIYDKGKQYDLNEHILRYELKVFKMQVFERKNINLKTLSDLLNPGLYPALLETISDSLSNLYMFDYRIKLAQVKSRNHRLILTECINTGFWNEYRKTHSPKGYKKKLARFRGLVNEYAPDNLQTYLQNEVENKWNDLQNSTPFLPHVATCIGPSIYPYIVGNNYAPIKRYCITCGRDISNQKPTSVFCSEKLYGKSAKRCRNRVSNLKRDEKRKYNGPTLFDIDQFLTSETMRLKAVAFH